MLQSEGSQRVRHDLATEEHWQCYSGVPRHIEFLGGPGWGGVARVGDFDFLNICSGTSESPALAQCLLWSEDTSSFHVNYQERELVTYCGLSNFVTMRMMMM